MSDIARGRTSFGLRGVEGAVDGAASFRARPRKLALDDSLFMLFVGPKADRYAAVRDDMYDAGGGKPGIVPSWCWPAFFFPQFWLLYRKQWMLGLAVFVLPVIAVYLFQTKSLIGWAISFVVAIFGRSLYVMHAERRIRNICELGLSAEETRARIERAGGVSPLALVVALIVMVLLIVVVAVRVAALTHGLHHR